MARYIMANRRAGKTGTDALARSRQAASQSLLSLFAGSVDTVFDVEPADERRRRIVGFEAEPEEVERKRAQLPPDVIIEPAIAHYPVAAFAPFDLMRPHGAPAAPPLGRGLRLSVLVNGPAGPLAQAAVQAHFRDPSGLAAEVVVLSAQTGRAEFEYGAGWQPVALVVEPYADHWAMLVRAPFGSTLQVDCRRLPAGLVGWWHRRVGLAAADAGRGAGIKVGVIDTGCGDHPALAHVKGIGAFVGGLADAAGTDDVDSHGTHVCGSIGARPADARAGYEGVGPGVELFAARVFASADRGADQGDIVMAIDALALDHGVDLINLSLGAARASQIEHDAVLDALDRGCLCICAAGNEAPARPDVAYPAAFAECVAVSALGMDRWAPAGSLSAARRPVRADHFGRGGLFLANFSCYGNAIATAAPGVAVIATVPARHGLMAPHAGMDGTSMASPVACGTLAVLLAQDPAYLSLPRTRLRADHARRRLERAGQDAGLDRRYQGQGLCRVF